jgi:proline dehydrogenase
MNAINKLVVATLPLVPKAAVRRVAARYIAGETLNDAIRVVKQLNAQGACATIDELGEDITHADEARAVVQDDKIALAAIFREKLDSRVSVKPTQLGLKISQELCLENMRELLMAARSYGNFARMDMEDSTCTQDTIEIYRRLRAEGFDNVGLCIQAYLRRSEADVRELVKLGANFRLCKGIYVEPAAIAFKDHDQINANFLRLLRIMFEARCYVGIATHDEYVVEGATRLIQEFALKRSEYEFQMLLGVRWGLRKQLIDAGHHVRVYVPFGKDWYAYSMRRFKENPTIAGYVVKSLFSVNGNRRGL